MLSAPQERTIFDVHSAVILIYFIDVQLRLAAIVTTQRNVECVGLQFWLALNKKNIPCADWETSEKNGRDTKISL